MVILTLHVLSPYAIAGKPKPLECDWVGEAVDPFTGKDLRTLKVDHGVTNVIVFHRPEAGAIPLDVSFVEKGLTESEVTDSLQFLLSDTTVVQVPMQSVIRTPSAGGGSVFTRFSAKASIPSEDVAKFHSVGVRVLRFPIPTAPFTVTLDEGGAEELSIVARCLAQ